jgi:hypothetical protein
MRIFRTKQDTRNMLYYTGVIPNSFCDPKDGCPGKQEDDDIAFRALRQTLNSTLVNNLISYDNVCAE